MIEHGLLAELTVAARTPSGARVDGRIDDAWGIVFAQGGVVMAVMMHAADVVLARTDLRVVTIAATFCRPVPCGPVSMEVTVLRSGRHGAQVHVELRAAGDDDPSPNAVATVVCAAESPGWPALLGSQVPDALTRPPDAATPRIGGDADRPPSAFFRQTEWREAHPTATEPLRRLAWFSFADTPYRPDGTWMPAMLAIPADALGLAAVPPVTEAMGLLTAPSLQITLQLFAPARGRWLGIDSRCTDIGGSLATGTATLWSDTGELVASATQTAMLRQIPA